MPCPLPQAVRHAALRSAIQRLGSRQGLGSRLLTMVGNALVYKQLLWLQGASAQSRASQCAPRLRRAREGGASLLCVSTGRS